MKMFSESRCFFSWNSQMKKMQTPSRPGFTRFLVILSFIKCSGWLDVDNSHASIIYGFFLNIPTSIPWMNLPWRLLWQPLTLFNQDPLRSPQRTQTLQIHGSWDALCGYKPWHTCFPSSFIITPVSLLFCWMQFCRSNHIQRPFPMAAWSILFGK